MTGRHEPDDPADRSQPVAEVGQDLQRIQMVRVRWVDGPALQLSDQDVAELGRYVSAIEDALARAARASGARLVPVKVPPVARMIRQRVHQAAGRAVALVVAVAESPADLASIPGQRRGSTHESTTAAAARLGVGGDYLRRLCRDGRVPGARLEGRKWLIPPGTQLPSRKR